MAVTEGSGGRAAAVADREPTLTYRPPGRLYHSVLLVPVILLLYAFSSPTVHLFALLLSLWTLGCMAVVWVVRMSLFLWGSRRRGAVEGRRWAVAGPVVALLTSMALNAELPLEARWMMSRADFDVAAAAALEGGDGRTELPDRLGWYELTDVEVVGGQVVFDVRTVMPGEDSGFAYLPGGMSDIDSPTRPLPRYLLRPLGGDWYAWSYIW
ncbi:hypothetical protein [Actinomarinicola tropica]|uniref:Uncharacterized protein n=1 Tax=Actinomarinicola tropica TaxID=2789776 RepID=A0A5Q2RS45_9ACTN|nr:hypothetical protein [Actinomarinicola tropica]QGG96015.1 hypothetical protein GH723_13415 [Actinomarinicola tropica]